MQDKHSDPIYNVHSFHTLSADMYNMLTAIIEAAPPLDEEEDGICLLASSASIRDSLVRITYYEQHFPKKAVHKIEYELIPLTETMLNSIYYWGCVYPDKDKTACYNNSSAASIKVSVIVNN